MEILKVAGAKTATSLSIPGEIICTSDLGLLRGRGIYETSEVNHVGLSCPPSTTPICLNNHSITTIGRLSRRHDSAYATIPLKRKRFSNFSEGMKKRHNCTPFAYTSSWALVSCTCGALERVDKLVHMNSLTGHRRYVAQVGDVVIGRIIEVGPKKWKLDINAYRNATLHLSGVNLDGCPQRMLVIRTSHLPETQFYTVFFCLFVFFLLRRCLINIPFLVKADLRGFSEHALSAYRG